MLQADNQCKTFRIFIVGNSVFKIIALVIWFHLKKKKKKKTCLTRPVGVSVRPSTNALSQVAIETALD